MGKRMYWTDALMILGKAYQSRRKRHWSSADLHAEGIEKQLREYLIDEGILAQDYISTLWYEFTVDGRDKYFELVEAEKLARLARWNDAARALNESEG